MKSQHNLPKVSKSSFNPIFTLVNDVGEVKERMKSIEEKILALQE